MNIKESYNFSILSRAVYTNFSTKEQFETDLFDVNKHITFTFANQAHAQEVTDNYDFIWQYNDPLTGFSGRVFQEKSSSKPIAAFRRTECHGAVVVVAGVFVAATRFNGSIWSGQTVKTI